MRFLRLIPLAVLAGSLLLTAGCDSPVDTLLQPQAPGATGIDFVNQLAESDSVSILTYEYLYNGAGVGVGDFDNNGLPDLYFSGNMTSSELYLQESPWRFRKVTAEAGVGTERWSTGVNVHDVDGNGFEDIYLATLSLDGKPNSPNLLFLNQGPGPDGIPRFQEAAAAYGLAHPGYGTHSAWIDLEKDGDLDLYVLNNSLETYSRKTLRGTDTTGTARSQDVVYERLSAGDTLFRATDLLKTEGWGLGVVPQDFNLDGYTDLYVANDFISEDGYLINNRAGGFDWMTQEAFAHTSKNSMGVDAGDINNDGLPDLVTVDMFPDDNLRQKTMFADINHSFEARARERGYGRQYVRNALQVNNGDGSFSDLSYLTGIAATDWSWTPLLADFDNDGHRDLFVSNGYPRDITNRDFVDFSQNGALFGTDEEVMQKVTASLNGIGGVHQPNYIFQNRGDLEFAVTDWMPDAPTYSNGAVYVDLDLDGDLDLVTNNLNEPAGLYRNQSRERQPETSHYLQLQLDGPAGNPDGLGTKVQLHYGNGRVSYAEQQRQRGYLSTVGTTLHFGLGTTTNIDSLSVTWPDGRRSLLRKVIADQRLVVSYDKATALPQFYGTVAATAPNFPASPPIQLRELPQPNAPEYHESPYTDFDNIPLAVRDHSKSGPALARLDLDGDGNPEIVLGGAAGQAVQILRFTAEGFQLVQELAETAPFESTALAVLDYDGDGDDDLFIGNGSSEFSHQKQRYRDQLYENDGGTLRPVFDLLPGLQTVTATVAVGDLEGDGDPDIFVGSRHQASGYPNSTPSYILINENGRFRSGPELQLGLVTDASWQDLNGDGLMDLAVVSEYGSPQIGLNQGGSFAFQPVPDVGTGWWYSINPGDLDGDGDTDFLLGNVGLNSRYRATAERPLTVRVEDYDDNGSLDPIMLAFNGNRAYPVHPRNTLGRQLPGFKRQATSYATYGGWSEENMPPLREQGYVLEATEFRSVYLENDGAGRFTPRYLPRLGQTAPVRDAVLISMADGRRAFLTVQNDYAVEVLGGPLDAGTGFALYLSEEGEPRIDPAYWSVRGDARSVLALGGRFVVGMNDGPLRVYAK